MSACRAARKARPRSPARRPFYDKPLADAVAAYQKGKGLPPNRQLNQRRSMRSTASAAHRDDQIIIVNIEAPGAGRRTT